MDFRATKDTYEREQEEAERLLRPAPKVKPPRHDKRRERISEPDPDIEGDKDVAKDPDLSMNYKTIGGSAQRIMARFLQADEPKDRIPVIRKDTGTPTYVTQKTLQERGDEYEKVDKKENGPKEETAPKDEKKDEDEDEGKEPKSKGGPEEKDYGSLGAQLLDSAKKNPGLKKLLKTMGDPKSYMANLPSDFNIRRLQGVEFPEGIDTVYDLREALQSGKKPKREKDQKDQVAEKLDKLISIMERFVSQAPAADRPKIEKQIDDAKKIVEETKAPEAKVPEKKPEETPKGDSPATAPSDKKELPKEEKAEIPPADGKKPEGDEKPAEGKKPPKEKAPKEKPPVPKEAPPKNDKKREQDDISAWEETGGLKSPEYKAWIEKDPRITVQDDGTALFPTRGGRLPWDQLSDSTKKGFYDQYQAHLRGAKNVESIKKLKDDPDTRKILQALADPKSNLSRRFPYRSEDLDIKKALPELKHVKLPPDMTLGDLQAAAKAAFPPLPAPKRRKVDNDAMAGAQMALVRNLAGQGALGAYVFKNPMHPDDARDLLTQFQAMKSVKLKPEDIEAEISKAQDYIVNDPSEIPYPTHDAKGRKWDKLSPQEQADTYAKHKNKVMAMNFALRDRIRDSLRSKSKMPMSLAMALTSSMLSKKKGTAEEQEERSRHAAKKVFNSVLKSGGDQEPIDEDVVRETLERAGSNSTARRIAVSYFQARDYLDARQQFLSADSPDRIDERDAPRQIAANLRKAVRFLKERQKRYPVEYQSGTDPVEKFSNRILHRLQVLNPEKAAEIEPQFHEIEADEWDDKKKVHDGLQAKWDKAKKKYDTAYAKAEAEFKAESVEDYRSNNNVRSIEERLKEQGQELPPEPDPLPPKPVGYDEVRGGQKGVRSIGRRLWNKLWHGKTSSAERVLDRFLTCEAEEAMGNSSPKFASDRTAVYWGVEPYPSDKGPAPYPKWQQAHARDLDENDFGGLLEAAREWMKQSMLSTAVEGIVPDTQFRAALDLAIRDHADGKYSVGLHPTLYNRLLARLAGKPETETLLTVREASSGSLYVPSTGEERSMRASAQVRKFASTIAESHPEIAFNLTDLALKLAEDEQQGQQEQGQVQAAAKTGGEMPEALKKHMEEKKKEEEGAAQDEGQKQASYRALKAAVVSAVRANPEARTAFIPVLQTIKKLG